MLQIQAMRKQYLINILPAKLLQMVQTWQKYSEILLLLKEYNTKVKSDVKCYKYNFAALNYAGRTNITRGLLKKFIRIKPKL